MNKLYRVVFNQSTGTWQAVPDFARGQGKTKSVRLAGLAVAAVLMGGLAQAQTLPTGGNIVAGSGSISTSGNVMTVTQGTAKMAADWQSFSIGAGSTVNFVQPSSTAVALNRVLGSDVSVIQGALNANGQVFLINPNGVLFTPTAQVNVGGIVASTLNMSTADFLAGNYRFEGGSSNAIVNQGNIQAANGGAVALIAAKITNEGSISAPGGQVLLGAGSKVLLDLGGPVKLLVEQGAIDALISNGGAIRANGGTVLLTAKAAGELASTVINNTGLIEAQTLATGE
ncbi:MAG: filamentous hemagglutinin N-terminal domain-containing protein, partial [Curvibacter sp.]